jgi:hypothetical protein
MRAVGRSSLVESRLTYIIMRLEIEVKQGPQYVDRETNRIRSLMTRDVLSETVGSLLLKKANLRTK